MAQQQIHRKWATLGVNKGDHLHVVVKKRKRKRLLLGSITKKFGANSSPRVVGTRYYFNIVNAYLAQDLANCKRPHHNPRRGLRIVQLQKENFHLVDLVTRTQEDKKNKKIIISRPVSPREKVFHDPSVKKIFKKILRQFNTRTLLNLRLVCSKWNNVATKILTRRKSFKIIFDLAPAAASSDDEDEGTSRIIIRNGNRRQFEKKTLDMLSTCLSGTKNGLFPCARFTICTEILAKLELQGFLYLHGRFIRDLELRPSSSFNCPTKINVTLLRKLLVEQATNIVSLKLGDISWDLTRPEEKLFSKSSKIKIFLPLLKLVSFNGPTTIPSEDDHEQGQQPSRIIGEILGAALNIQAIIIKSLSIIPTPLLSLDMLIEAKAIHAVKTLQFCPNQDTIEMYEKFADTQPKLKSITISSVEEEYNSLGLGKRISMALSKILDSSKDTLEIFKIRDQIPSLDNLHRFLLLKAVKIVELVNYSNGDHKTERLYWTHIFPNLDTLRVTGSGDQELPCTGIADTVQTLGISDDLSLDFIDKLVTSFPYVKRISVGLTKDFKRFGRALWNFELLKVIDLNMEHSTTNCFPKLDAVLTGFTVAECKFLYHFCHKISTYHCFNRKRSIIDLKHLRELKLHFIANSNFYSPRISEEKFLFLSAVCGFYVFQKMPQLDVKIFVQVARKELTLYGKSLQQISPFAEVHINVVHDGPGQQNNV